MLHIRKKTMEERTKRESEIEKKERMCTPVWVWYSSLPQGENTHTHTHADRNT